MIYYPSGSSSPHSLTDNGLVLNPSKGSGIYTNPASPALTFMETNGVFQPKTSGAGTPTLRQYRGGNAYEWSFAASDVVDITTNLPRDVASESTLDLHLHWSHNGTNISGTFTATYYYTYAKAYNQAVFHAEKQIEIAYNTVDITTTPQYKQRVDSSTLAIVGGSASRIDTADVEPCGIVMGRLIVTSLPTITGGYLFIHAANILYQSTIIGTVAKIPPFYTP